MLWIELEPLSQWLVGIVSVDEYTKFLHIQWRNSAVFLTGILLCVNVKGVFMSHQDRITFHPHS